MANVGPLAAKVPINPFGQSIALPEAVGYGNLEVHCRSASQFCDMRCDAIMTSSGH